MTERANIKQPTVNGGYSRLRGRMCTVILTSTHHWNLRAQGGQLLKMSVPLSIFICSSSPSLLPSPPMLCHSFVSFACCKLCRCVTLSCPKACLFKFIFKNINTVRLFIAVVVTRQKTILLLKHKSDLFQKSLTNTVQLYNSWVYPSTRNCKWYITSIQYMVTFTNEGDAQHQATFHNHYLQQPCRHNFLVAFLNI